MNGCCAEALQSQELIREEVEHEDQRADDHSAGWSFGCMSHHLLYEDLNHFHLNNVSLSDRKWKDFAQNHQMLNKLNQ